MYYIGNRYMPIADAYIQLRARSKYIDMMAVARHPHGWHLLALARQAQTSESGAFALKAAGACRALRL